MARVPIEFDDASEILKNNLDTEIDQKKVKSLQDELDNHIQAYGECHYIVIDQLSRIGLYHQHITSRLSDAMQYFSNVLRIIDRMIASQVGYCGCVTSGYSTDVNLLLSHLKVQKGVAMTDIGNVLVLMRQPNEAVQRFNEAIHIFKSTGMGDMHPRVVSTKLNVQRAQAWSIWLPENETKNRT